MTSLSDQPKFPWHVFHPKNFASPARRLADISHWRSFRNPPKFRSVEGGLTGQFSYVTLTCRRDLHMTRVSLASMLSHATQLPRLILAHDESISTDEIRDYFSDWPGELECYSREETGLVMTRKQKPFLASFCARHIFGFKLSACLRASANTRVLYSDADVLWFGDCNELMAAHQKDSILGSSDIGKAIDEEVVAMLDNESARLVSLWPRICAGFAIYNKSLLDHPILEQVVPQIVGNAKIGRLAEQTLVAALARQEGGVIPDDHVQMIEPNSAAILRSRFGRAAFARHYPFQERPQFWIDSALA